MREREYKATYKEADINKSRVGERMNRSRMEEHEDEMSKQTGNSVIGQMMAGDEKKTFGEQTIECGMYGPEMTENSIDVEESGVRECEYNATCKEANINKSRVGECMNKSRVGV